MDVLQDLLVAYVRATRDALVLDLWLDCARSIALAARADALPPPPHLTLTTPMALGVRIEDEAGRVLYDDARGGAPVTVRAVPAAKARDMVRRASDAVLNDQRVVDALILAPASGRAQTLARDAAEGALAPPRTGGDHDDDSGQLWVVVDVDWVRARALETPAAKRARTDAGESAVGLTDMMEEMLASIFTLLANWSVWRDARGDMPYAASALSFALTCKRLFETARGVTRRAQRHAVAAGGVAAHVYHFESLFAVACGQPSARLFEWALSEAPGGGGDMRAVNVDPEEVMYHLAGLRARYPRPAPTDDVARDANLSMCARINANADDRVRRIAELGVLDYAIESLDNYFARMIGYVLAHVTLACVDAPPERFLDMAPLRWFQGQNTERLAHRLVNPAYVDRVQHDAVLRTQTNLCAAAFVRGATEFAASRGIWSDARYARALQALYSLPYSTAVPILRLAVMCGHEFTARFGMPFVVAPDARLLGNGEADVRMALPYAIVYRVPELQGLWSLAAPAPAAGLPHRIAITTPGISAMALMSMAHAAEARPSQYSIDGTLLDVLFGDLRLDEYTDPDAPPADLLLQALTTVPALMTEAFFAFDIDRLDAPRRAMLEAHGVYKHAGVARMFRAESVLMRVFYAMMFSMRIAREATFLAVLNAFVTYQLFRNQQTDLGYLAQWALNYAQPAAAGFFLELLEETSQAAYDAFVPAQLMDPKVQRIVADLLLAHPVGAVARTRGQRWLHRAPGQWRDFALVQACIALYHDTVDAWLAEHPPPT